MVDQNTKTLGVLLLILLVATGVWVQYNKDRQVEKKIKILDAQCVEFGETLTEYGQNCSCYYSSCESQSVDFNDLTTPFCGCDCTQNGTTARVCIRVAEFGDEVELFELANE